MPIHSESRSVFVLARTLLFFGLLIGRPSGCPLNAQEIKNSPPHIVFILADDLGYNDCSYGGNSRYQTKHLDQLAAKATILDSLYVQPVCTPTRAALMTGRYPMRYGLQVGVIRPEFDYGLAQEERTLAEELKEIGYHTSIVGKWHLGWREPWMMPLERGFDSQYGMLMSGAIDYYTHERAPVGVDWFRQQEQLNEEGYSTDLIAAEAVSQIQSHDLTQPLFLYVAFNSPHSPYQTPLNDNADQLDSLPKPRRDYARMVIAMDEGIGRISEALEARGMLDSSIVIFSSDNGGVAPAQRADNRPLRDGKGSLYEGGVRSRGFIRYPSAIPTRRLEMPMHTVDWYPTLVAAAGGTVVKQDLDGVNQWNRLTDQEPAIDHDRTILLNAAPRGSALRQGKWKLLRTRNEQASVDISLYDLETDLSETNNVALENPEVVSRLIGQLEVFEREQVPPLAR